MPEDKVNMAIEIANEAYWAGYDLSYDEDVLREDIQKLSEETVDKLIEKYGDEVNRDDPFANYDKLMEASTIINAVLEGRTDEEINLFLDAHSYEDARNMVQCIDAGGTLEQAEFYCDGKDFMDNLTYHRKFCQETLREDTMQEVFGNLYGSKGNVTQGTLTHNMDKFLAEASEAIVRNVSEICTSPEKTGELDNLLHDFHYYDPYVFIPKETLNELAGDEKLSDGQKISDVIEKLYDDIQSKKDLPDHHVPLEDQNAVTQNEGDFAWCVFGENLLQVTELKAEEMLLGEDGLQMQNALKTAIVFGLDTELITQCVQNETRDVLQSVLQSGMYEWSDADVRKLGQALSEELTLEPDAFGEDGKYYIETYMLGQRVDMNNGFENLKNSYEEFKDSCEYGNAGYILEFFGEDRKFMDTCLNEYREAKESGNSVRCEEVESLVHDFLENRMHDPEHDGEETIKETPPTVEWTRRESDMFFENMAGREENGYFSRFEAEHAMNMIQTCGLSNEEKEQLTEAVLGESNTAGFMMRRASIGIESFEAVNESELFSNEEKTTLKNDILNLVGENLPDYDHRYDVFNLDDELSSVIRYAEFIAGDPVKTVEECIDDPHFRLYEVRDELSYEINHELKEENNSEISNEITSEQQQKFEEHGIDTEDFGYDQLMVFEKLIDAGVPEDALNEITEDTDISPEHAERMGMLAIVEQNMADEKQDIEQEPDLEFAMAFTGDDVADDFDH